eukprot:117627-Chlamydomonas_euryale.AAC.1
MTTARLAAPSCGNGQRSTRCPATSQTPPAWPTLARLARRPLRPTRAAPAPCAPGARRPGSMTTHRPACAAASAPVADVTVRQACQCSAAAGPPAHPSCVRRGVAASAGATQGGEGG